ncbi:MULTISPECIES: hypothetical protein [unclassified Streptomyces]|uniref:hypothetical protein n=1 Tax=unclassified Streptomyces TaxID=2593676 RepID=UPI001F5440A0|nr:MULTISPECIES: hypothetical protein [unclassified Streptomyces]
MRVLFPALAICSLGLLLWAPLLRLACVRRRAADWWTAGAGFVLVCVLLPIIGQDGPEGETNRLDDIFIPLLLIAMAGACAHYLVADIRHYARLTARFPDRGTALPQPAPHYGYATTVPLPTPLYGPHVPLPAPPPYAPPRAQPPAPRPHTTPHTPTPTPPPPPHRIDQVRAELDELSDYLRKEEGR